MPNKLYTLLPPTVLADPVQTATELPRAVLMRVNFIPGVRQRLGWRGVRECTATSGGLTLKIAEHSGIFGISQSDTTQLARQGNAGFNLFYFPDPDEELLEAFSVAACIEALRTEYLDKVREFTRFEQLRLFQLGRLEVAYDSVNGAVGLTLVAADRQLLVSADGLTVTGLSGPVQAVAPGGIDQDLDAFAILMPLYRTLAASFSFCLGEAPVQLQRSSRVGRKVVCHPDNRFTEAPLMGAKEFKLMLGWRDPDGLNNADPEFPTVELQWQAPLEKPQDYADEPWWSDRVPGARFSLDKNSVGISERPKLIVLTGFLGSGKTSFLNHFIEYHASRNAFVAIVQNEIGARGLDSHLLGQHYAVTEMDEGCVCCTLAGNLKLALAEILSGFQPDFVVLETTGLANPANFLHEISELEDQLDFCSITTLVDASQGTGPLEKYPVAREQLMLADVILANKIDQVETRQLSELKDWIGRLNPLAVIHEVNHGDVSPAQLYGVNFAGKMRLPERSFSAGSAGHTHLDQGISSLLIRLPEPLERDSFLAQTALLPPQVLRVKGILEFNDEPDPQVYQYVPGAQALTPVAEDPGERFLVMIGENIEEVTAPFLRTLNLAH